MSWCRYEDVSYAPMVDEYDQPRGVGTIEVVLRRFPVVRETPKGVWLDLGWRHRFVLSSSRKRFACPTVEEARESFVARKRAQIRIYTARADRARRALLALDDVK